MMKLSESEWAEWSAKGLSAAVDEIYRLRTELLELQSSFDLRWDADMRAIKLWQAAAPGREQTWPDHAEMVLWLLQQLDETRHERNTNVV
jgi:hypothetical protein